MIVDVIDLDAGGFDPGRQLFDLENNKQYYIYRLQEYWLVIFDCPMTPDEADEALADYFEEANK